jgi:hypothetical protein
LSAFLISSSVKNFQSLFARLGQICFTFTIEQERRVTSAARRILCLKPALRLECEAKMARTKQTSVDIVQLTLGDSVS